MNRVHFEMDLGQGDLMTATIEYTEDQTYTLADFINTINESPEWLTIGNVAIQKNQIKRIIELREA